MAIAQSRPAVADQADPVNYGNDKLITKRQLSEICRISLAAFLLGACATSVQVDGSFPKPLMQPYPLAVGVRYPDSLVNFSHTEKAEREPEVAINLGAANVRMFDALFAGMFTEVVRLDADQARPAAANADLIIEPTLVELEIASPNKSGTDQYTVWLNYNLRLYRPDQTLLGDWKITGYGQHDGGSMGMGTEDAVNGAAMLAMRDAAAAIATRFSEAPGIGALLLPQAADPQPGSNNDIDSGNTENAAQTDE